MNIHTLQLADTALTEASNARLILAALLGIATVVALIVWAKMHPFISLILGAAVMGGAAGVTPLDIVASFTLGFGATVGSVGLLIALGAMIGAILADSGGSDSIVDTIIGRVGATGLPWAMAAIAAILGLPLFFEVGVVLLVPVVLLVAVKLDVPLMRVGIPALAGLSILHALVPPHPGPLVAIENLGADLGLSLLLGLVVAIPTLVVCGPLLARAIEVWVPARASALARAVDVSSGRLPAPAAASPGSGPSGPSTNDPHESSPLHVASSRRPSFVTAVFCVTLPVALMLARAIAELTIEDEDSTVLKALIFVGTPSVALLAAVLVSMWFLGFRTGMDRKRVENSLGSGLPGIASILLIVAAGGGFKTVLVDAGVGDVIGDWAQGSGISVLLLGWLVAVGVRLATGSATVATITASGIVSGAAATLGATELALLVLAIGSGSVFFSHVNDAGFWLVKEYFGLTVGQTIKSWSLMETAISIMGLVMVLLVNIVI